MPPIVIPIRLTRTEPEPGAAAGPSPPRAGAFQLPQWPGPGPEHDLAGARDVLQAFVPHFDRWLSQGGDPAAVELRELAPAVLRVIDLVLGRGEVVVTVDDDVRIDEMQLSGAWRQRHFSPQGALLRDLLVAAPMPPLVARRAQAQASARLRDLPLPAAASDLHALLARLQLGMDLCTEDSPSSIVNLTLLTLSEEAAAHLDRLLEGGTVLMVLRGGGNCRISSTAARHVWRVQYFDQAQQLVLNTLEIVAMPELALAAREDLEETRQHLAEVVRALGERAAR